MTKLPIPTGKEVIAALKKVGFSVVRIRGSHHFLIHDEGGAQLFQSIQVKKLVQVCYYKFYTTVN